MAGERVLSSWALLQRGGRLGPLSPSARREARRQHHRRTHSHPLQGSAAEGMLTASLLQESVPSHLEGLEGSRGDEAV